MRTTLTLPDDLFATLKEEAHREDRSFKATVEKVLRAGLMALRRPSEAEPYRLDPVCMGRPAAGIDLDKALGLAERLEDEAILRKLELRK